MCTFLFKRKHVAIMTALLRILSLSALEGIGEIGRYEEEVHCGYRSCKKNKRNIIKIFQFFFSFNLLICSFNFIKNSFTIPEPQHSISLIHDFSKFEASH